MVQEIARDSRGRRQWSVRTGFMRWVIFDDKTMAQQRADAVAAYLAEHGTYPE